MKHGNLINGVWSGSRSGATFAKHNPADQSDFIGDFADSTAEDAEDAVAAAHNAYEHWRLTPAPVRAGILFRAAEILTRRKEEFARDMTREMGKVLKEAGGDVQEAIDMSYYIAGEGRRLFGHTTPSELKDKFMMSVRLPLGVAACITPWNFPMAIPSWKIAPALVSGNTVVLKPSPDAPLSALHFAEALQDAGLPPGVLNVVTGSLPEPGIALVNHPDVRIVSFTGSTETGRKINESSAVQFKRVSLEMGGKNAIMIMDDANLELALEGCLWGGFGTTGQRCTAASRVLVHEKVHDEFVERFIAKAQKLRVGNGLDPEVEMGPLASEAQLKKTESYVEIGKQEGAVLKCGGHRLSDGSFARGYFYAPTIFSEVHREMRIAREEIFGPVVSVLRIRTLDEAISIANEPIYGLSSSLYSANVNAAFRVMRDLNAGITYINAPTIGAEVHLPFGGTKQTGNGHREGGPTVLDLYTEWKTIYVDFSQRLQKAQID